MTPDHRGGSGPPTSEQRSDVPRATLHVMVGLPGAGKTTRARQIEQEQGALRLTPDEWMIPLFGEAEAAGKRDVLEGRFVSLAIQVLRRGFDVVLDFGVWTRDERSALRQLAMLAGARCVLVYLPVDPGQQRARIKARSSTDLESTFPIEQADLDRYRGLFQVPDEQELTSDEIDPPPAGHETWLSWAAERWPTLTL